MDEWVGECVRESVRACVRRTGRSRVDGRVERWEDGRAHARLGYIWFMYREDERGAQCDDKV